MLASRTAVAGFLVAALASLVVLVAMPRTSADRVDVPVPPGKTRSWAQEIALDQGLGEVRQIIHAEAACFAEIRKIRETCSYTEFRCDRDEDIARMRTLLTEAERLGDLARAKLDQLRL
jgi:hypothetical protein